MNSIKTDLQFLCGELEDRQAQTDEEKRAAQHVADRLAGAVDNVRRVDFDSVGNYRMMFAAYCGEFIVINLLALWWPTVAFFYGIVIFLAYMAEFLGYAVFSRFLPHFESSSAVGLSEAHDAACVLIFTAYLDTDDNPFSRVEASLARYYLHYLIILGMVFVLTTCGIDTLGTFTDTVNPYTPWMRWVGIGLFSVLSIIGIVRMVAVRQNRGANNNASGVAGLLHIAERLREFPIENTTVLFYAAGSHYANMTGMRTMLTENPGMAENTYLINIESIGSGKLYYSIAEGMLHPISCDPALVAAARTLRNKYQANHIVVNNRRTNAYLPLMRGIPAISVMRLDETELPAYFGVDQDLCENVDSQAIKEAAEFAEAIGRETAKKHRAIPGIETTLEH